MDEVPRVTVGGLQVAPLTRAETAELMINRREGTRADGSPAAVHIGKWRGAVALLVLALDTLPIRAPLSANTRRRQSLSGKIM
jgi:hypothetical protein